MNKRTHNNLCAILIVVLLLAILLVTASCTTFKYSVSKDGVETLSGTTWFKSFKDIHAKRGTFSLEIGESTVDAPNITGDIVCIAKLQAGLTCD